MTADPEIRSFVPGTPPPEMDVTTSAILEDIFLLGYAKSEPMHLFTQEKDGQTLKLVAEYRTLLPAEIRDVFEDVQRYQSFLGQLVTEQIETLARGIVQINGMRLALDQTDRAALVKEFRDSDQPHPTPLAEARYILTHKIKSPMVIDLLFEGYKKFTNKVKDAFDDVKKKLNDPPSSASTSS